MNFYERFRAIMISLNEELNKIQESLSTDHKHIDCECDKEEQKRVDRYVLSRELPGWYDNE